MADDTPKIASTLESSMLLGTGLLFVQAVFVWGRSHLFALAFVIFAVALVLRQLRILSTKLACDGVSQLTWRGRILVRWNEITVVTRQLRSITVTGIGGTAIVPIESFDETQAAIQFVNSHLPNNLRQT